MGDNLLLGTFLLGKLWNMPNSWYCNCNSAPFFPIQENTSKHNRETDISLLYNFLRKLFAYLNMSTELEECVWGQLDENGNSLMPRHLPESHVADISHESVHRWREHKWAHGIGNSRTPPFSVQFQVSYKYDFSTYKRDWPGWKIVYQWKVQQVLYVTQYWLSTQLHVGTIFSTLF